MSGTITVLYLTATIMSGPCSHVTKPTNDSVALPLIEGLSGLCSNYGSAGGRQLRAGVRRLWAQSLAGRRWGSIGFTPPGGWETCDMEVTGTSSDSLRVGNRICPYKCQKWQPASARSDSPQKGNECTHTSDNLHMCHR